MSKSTLKSATPAPTSEAEKIAAEIEQTEREYRERTERLRAEGLALAERRRPANEAVDKLRRLVALVLNARPFVAAARQRANEFDEAITEQLSGGRVDSAILEFAINQNPSGANAARLVGIAGPWLEGRERELAALLHEARELATAAPDNAGLLAEIEAIKASVG
jgi:hypothetical protein